MKTPSIFWHKQIALLPLFNFALRGKQRLLETEINWSNQILHTKSPYLGVLGSFDFRIFCELIKRMSNQRKKDYFPPRIEFRLSEFAQSLGLGLGGRQLSAIDESFQRLHETHFNWVSRQQNQNERRERFILLQGIIDRKNLRQNNEAYWVQFSQFVMDSLNRQDFYYFPLSYWERIKTDIGRGLYLKLVPQLLKTQKQGKLVRSYDDICIRLGLRPYTAPSKAKEKLGPALQSLVEAQIIHQWDIRKGQLGLMLDIEHQGMAFGKRLIKTSKKGIIGIDKKRALQKYKESFDQKSLKLNYSPIDAQEVKPLSTVTSRSLVTAFSEKILEE